MLKAKFITDKVPPVISAASLSSPFLSPNGDGRMDTATVRLAVTGHLRFGWDVKPFFDGIVSAAILRGSVVGKIVAFTWDGKNAAGKVVPDGPYRITVWTADASNNKASISKVVTVDRRAAGVTLGALAGLDLAQRRRPLGPARGCPGRPTSGSPGRRACSTGTAPPSVAGRSPRAPPDRGSGTAGTRPGRRSPTAATRSASEARPGRQPDRPRPDRPRRPDDPVGDLGAVVVHPASGPEGPVDARPAPEGDGHRRDLPGLDAGPPDLDGSCPGGRHVRLDVERQDGRRRVRQARDATGSWSTRRAASGRPASLAT